MPKAPNGAIFICGDYMQAHELKIIADRVNKEKEDPQIESGYKNICQELKELAQQGLYSYTFYLSHLKIKRKVWEEIAKKLQKNGFKTSFDVEITNWYSNTDYDQEDVIKICWL